MKSICFFSSYYANNDLPNYVKYYLQELRRHFSEIVFITTEKQFSAPDELFFEVNKIQKMTVKNEGYDFGMWYKALCNNDVTKYDRIGLVNDSCILFNKLDSFFNWVNTQSADYYGITDSYMFNYHIQSYFIIVNKNAIPLVTEYFTKNGIIKNFNQVINIYELGLSGYLMNAGMRLIAYYACKDKTNIDDPTFMRAKELIKMGFPFVKKRILTRNYGSANWRWFVIHGFDPYPSHYIKLIRKTLPAVNTEELLAGLPLRKSFKEEVGFYTIAFLCQIYRSIFRRIINFIKRIIFFILKKIYRLFQSNPKQSATKTFIYRILH